MRIFTIGILSVVLVPRSVLAQVNAGELPAESNQPFSVTKVTTLNLPWRIAFLPDGRMLITEKVGPIWLVTQDGTKMPVENVPAVLAQGQGGMLGIFLSPQHATDHKVYLTYSEPGDGGSSLALARATLSIGKDSASLDGLEVLWHQMPKGRAASSVRRSPFRPMAVLSSSRWATGSG